MKVLLVGRTHNRQLDQASIQSFYQLDQGNMVVDLFIPLESDQSLLLPKDIFDRLRKVLVGIIATASSGLPEDQVSVIADLAKGYDLVVAGKGHLMDQAMARCAASLGKEPLLGITKIIDNNTLQYHSYNHSVVKTVYSEGVPKIITMATGLSVSGKATDLVEVKTGASPKIKVVATTCRMGGTKLKSFEGNDAGRGDLGEAQIIIGCGAGVDSLDSLESVKELAKVLGAALGASKMMVEAGYLPSSALIGQSGKTVSPKVYLALGISGSMHHLGAVQGSDIIIAVNADSEAPIIRMSDYGLIGDINEIIPKLTGLLKNWDSHHGN